MVILVVGRAGAGKTTHAKRLAEEYRDRGLMARVLDGDAFRGLNGNKDYSDAGRLRNLKGMAETAQMIEMSGICIVACVAPKRELREMMRSMWRESRLVYLPGGTLWEGTEFEVPSDGEFDVYGK